MGFPFLGIPIRKLFGHPALLPVHLTVFKISKMSLWVFLVINNTLVFSFL